MTVKEIVAAYLKANGYDGLCDENCGCYPTDDGLFICEGDGCLGCRPGYQQIITDSNNDAYGEEGIGPNKPDALGWRRERVSPADKEQP